MPYTVAYALARCRLTCQCRACRSLGKGRDHVALALVVELAQVEGNERQERIALIVDVGELEIRPGPEELIAERWN